MGIQPVPRAVDRACLTYGSIALILDAPFHGKVLPYCLTPPPQCFVSSTFTSLQRNSRDLLPIPLSIKRSRNWGLSSLLGDGTPDAWAPKKNWGKAGMAEQCSPSVLHIYFLLLFIQHRKNIFTVRAMGWMFVCLSNSYWNPKPQCDGIWRWAPWGYLGFHEVMSVGPPYWV